MKKVYKRKSGKRGPVRAKKLSYDGIDFASGLEKYMYIALRKAKIKFTYELRSFELLPSFSFNQDKPGKILGFRLAAGRVKDLSFVKKQN